MEIKFKVDLTLDPRLEGLDIHAEYPGENDQVWCGRCKRIHSRGPPGFLAEARHVDKLSRQIVDEINAETIKEIEKELFAP